MGFMVEANHIQYQSQLIYPNTGIKPIVKETDIMKVNTIEQYKVLKYIKMEILYIINYLCL
ncbi:hypothetical protein CNEO4_570007 [Clostridium neonatale]|nr:hypothetical protein CNEO2_500007 [Clostridium neonatale]CAI3247336.1 hypothetical protein CNEO2_720001 [Clostridium neonatale]CAI3606312.1 hypothetical protein CNEO4_230007 [Clostridium neonatale]CAI3667889.1 hypothetical protein CNEO4_420028 [Clostridium neonatale]CAI3693235.1 hypothetical protein CNEO4_570007 [Clostridium neonatale]